MDKELKGIVESLKKYKEEMPLKYTDYQMLDEMVTKLERIESQRILFRAYPELSKNDKLLLIRKFHQWYYNTDQDNNVFAEEYYNVVDDILHGRVPVKLQFLTDYTDLLIDEFPELRSQIEQRLSEAVC